MVLIRIVYNLVTVEKKKPGFKYGSTQYVKSSTASTEFL